MSDYPVVLEAQAYLWDGWDPRGLCRIAVPMELLDDPEALAARLRELVRGVEADQRGKWSFSLSLETGAWSWWWSCGAFCGPRHCCCIPKSDRPPMPTEPPENFDSVKWGELECVEEGVSWRLKR